MPNVRVAVLGGGPAGLTAARILKLREPSWEITLFERHHPEQTFGYGVGLGHSAFAQLSSADEPTALAIEEASLHCGTWTMRRDAEIMNVSNDHGTAISRTALLTVLHRQAVLAGVIVQPQQAVSVSDLDGHDVVVAADGVSSSTRESLVDELGATSSLGDLAYIWCGAEISLPSMTLAIATTDAGPLTAHVMPYSPTSSTFQVDANTEVLRALGLLDAAGVTDVDRTLAFLETTYADLLGGVRLQAKRAQWSTFATVACGRWSSGNVIVIGDAAHTAHYTVGSGTGLAVQDGMVLAESLAGAGSFVDAFTAYETARRPKVEHIQRRAALSEQWWSTLPARVGLPLQRLFLSYLTRTGALTLPILQATNAQLLSDCLGSGDGTDLVERVLAQPFAHNGSSLPTRVFDLQQVPAGALVGTLDVDGPGNFLDAAATLRGEGVDYLRLTGPADRTSLLHRLDVAESVRTTLPVSVVVCGPETGRDDLALGVLSERTDLVEIL